MLPTLWPGDVIAVRRTPGCDIRPGRLVVYALKEFDVHRVVRWDPNAAKMTTGVIVNMFTVHRAVRYERDALITRGDALLGDDPPVQLSRIFGEVVAIQRGRSHIVPREKLTRTQELFCFFLRRSRHLQSLLLHLHSLRHAMNRSPAAPEPIS
jgi:hypothetical protein